MKTTVSSSVKLIMYPANLKSIAPKAAARILDLFLCDCCLTNLTCDNKKYSDSVHVFYISIDIDINYILKTNFVLLSS